MYNYYYLSHHGIQGQTWGNRHGPPYPLSKSVSRKISKRAKGNFETKEERDKRRERALKEGNATEVLEFASELSNTELINALNRVKWTNELERISKSEMEIGWTTLEGIMKKVGSTRDWIRIGLDLYNLYDIVNKIVKKK